jgi:hypothetical protein
VSPAAESGPRPDPLNPLRALLASANRPTLLLVDPSAARAVSSLEVEGVTTVGLAEAGAKVEGPWETVVLAAADRAALRASVGLLPLVGNVFTVAIWLLESAQPMVAEARPEWPRLAGLTARRGPRGSVLTVAEFVSKFAGKPLLTDLVRQSTPGRDAQGGLFIASTTGRGAAGDADVRVLDDVAEAADPEADVPPDVVLADRQPATPLPVHEVIGRAPVVITPEPGFGPLDERVLTPIDFKPNWKRPPVPLTVSAGRVVLGEKAIDPARGVTERMVEQLRPAQGVRVDVADASLSADVPVVLAKVLAGLALAGVPVVGPAPSATRALLGDRLSAVLSESVDLDDPLAREEHSVLLRRAGYDDHGTLAWRTRVAGRAGVRFAGWPSVSVVLATKRPHQLEFALRQIARQRGLALGTDLEVVIAGHGWQPDEAVVRKHLGTAATVLARPADEYFGDVLQAGVRAASGDVLLKFDDDDWYGPDVITDLLRARHFSGSELTGMPAQYTYLQPVATTIRRSDRVEFYARFVAGGTMMVDRDLMRDVGGFRSVRRYVDASLLEAVRAVGGRVYRTHGLGYVMRRTGEGHTWEPGLDYFLDDDRVGTTTAGFVPSRLLEADPVDLPSPGPVRA